jgi:hypothetical protein
MTNEDFKATKEEQIALIANELKSLDESQLDLVWEAAQVSISLVAAEKASRMGVKNPKIAVIALGGDEDIADILGKYAKVEGPMVTPLNDEETN